MGDDHHLTGANHNALVILGHSAVGCQSKELVKKSGVGHTHLTFYLFIYNIKHRIEINLVTKNCHLCSLYLRVKMRMVKITNKYKKY